MCIRDRKDVVEYPDREPDLTYEEACGYQWPLIYRLMGDWHQQHIDWAYTCLLYTSRCV